MSSFFIKFIPSIILIISFNNCNVYGTNSSPKANKVPILHILANDLSSFEVGLKIGEQSKALFENIESRYDRYLNAVLSQIAFDDILRDYLPLLRQSTELRYLRELEGVASSWSLTHKNKLGDGFLSWDEYWLLNLLPDIAIPANGVGFGVLSQVSHEDSVIIGRNLNFKSTPDLRSLQVITVYEYENRAVVNIGFAGIISVLSGYNESGLFVAQLNASSTLSYQNSYHIKNKQKSTIQPLGFILRKALETSFSTQEAINFISKENVSISRNTLVADKAEIRVLEQPAYGKAVIRNWNSRTHPNKQWDRKSQIAVVDCHVLKVLPNNCSRAKDGYQWTLLRSLARFSTSKKASVQDIAKIMLDQSHKYYEMLSDNTTQSMIYLPEKGYLYLYTAPIEEATDDIVNQPSYQVYYQDVIPEKLRKSKNKKYYIWFVSGLLILLLFAFWWVHQSISTTKKSG